MMRQNSQCHRHSLHWTAWAALCALMFIFASPSWAQQDALTATVDRTEVSIEETLTLRVRYAGQARGGSPDWSQLQQNFDIITQQRSNQISTINGVMNAFTEWALILSPKRVGKLLVPSFKYEGHFSDAIEVTVTEASAAPDDLRDIFVEAELDIEQPYVQQQVVLTYRLFTTRSIDSMDAEALQIDGVRIEELPQARYQRRINGRLYGVLEIPYALFPQTSDAFEVPSLRWTLRVMDSSGGRRSFGIGANHYELKRMQTPTKHVEVLPRPNSFPNSETWLPAKALTLSQEWSSPLSELRVGEPVTRTIRIEAQGLSAAQLPPLGIEENPTGLRIYPNQADQTDDATSEGITGIRTETMAVVPRQGGEVEIPAIEVAWWDTETDTLKTARLDAQTVKVEGQAPTPASPPIAGEPQQPASVPESPQDSAAEISATASDSSWNLWQWLALGFGVLWLVFALLWWRARRSASGPSHTGATSGQEEQRAFKALQQVAATGDLHQLRYQLLNWAAQRWPNQPPRSLESLGESLGDENLRQQLAELDAALYSPHKPASLDSKRLVDDIGVWRKSRTKVAENKIHLKPLY